MRSISTTLRQAISAVSYSSACVAAAAVFGGTTVEVEDTRKDYGETRIICYGLLAGRMVVVGYTPRGADRHIFSMRKANDREKDRIGPLLGI